MDEGKLFPSDHPSYKGNIKLGFNSSDEFEEFDTILAVGGLPRVSYMFSNPRMRIFNPKSQLIHIDNDPTQVATTEKTDVAIISDPSEALKILTTEVESKLDGNTIELVKEKNKIIQ